MAAIELDSVYKSYETLAVLRGLSLQIEAGEVYGVLGSRGAGKSTLLHVLLGFARPQKGRVRVLETSMLGLNKGRIGFAPERAQYHNHTTARAYLSLLGSLDDMPASHLAKRIDTELATVGLSEAAEQQLGTFSQAMLQRFGVAQALLHEPSLVLLDEPFGGLGVSAQGDMLQLLAEIRNRGCAMVITSQYIAGIEQVCDRVGVLFNGVIAAEATPESLRIPGRDLLITVDHVPDVLAARLAHVSAAISVEETAITISPNSAALQARVLELLLNANIVVLSLTAQHDPLADLYARVTHGESVDAYWTPRFERTQLAEAPPNSLFAPPGHADTTPPVDSAPQPEFIKHDSQTGSS